MSFRTRAQADALARWRRPRRVRAGRHVAACAVFWIDRRRAAAARRQASPAGRPDGTAAISTTRIWSPGPTLYLPVHVPGALLSIGDGHARAGRRRSHRHGARDVAARHVRGATCAKASGCAGRALRRRRTTSRWACTRTSTKRRASRCARWWSFWSRRRRLSRDDAYMLCSLAADLHVTQAVDATKGVHAMLAKSFFK